MAYDEDLANRIRAALADERGVDEKAMFGGLAFLLGGHMAVAAGSKGDLMVRVPRADTADLVAKANVEPMVMGGREMRGWLRVDPDGVRTSAQLRRWVALGADTARALPPK